MKNYNGIHNSACSINEHFPHTKTPITHSSTQAKPYIRPEEGFSAKVHMISLVFSDVLMF